MTLSRTSMMGMSGGPSITSPNFVSKIAGITRPDFLRVNGDGTKLYVIDRDTRKLFPITTSTKTLGTGITTGADAGSYTMYDFDYAPTGTNLYMPVVSGGGLVYKTINTSTNAVTASVASPNGWNVASGTVTSKNGLKQYVVAQTEVVLTFTFSGGSETYAIHPNGIDGTSPIGAGVQIWASILQSPDGSKLYTPDFLSGGKPGISIWNTSANPLTLATRVQLPVSNSDYPYAAAMSPDGLSLYVCYQTSTITKVSLVSPYTTSNISVSSDLSVTSLAVSPDGKALYFAAIDFNANPNIGSINLYTVDLSANTVAATKNSLGTYDPYTSGLLPIANNIAVYGTNIYVSATWESQVYHLTQSYA